MVTVQHELNCLECIGRAFTEHSHFPLESAHSAKRRIYLPIKVTAYKQA